MRIWPFRRKAKKEHYLGEYTEPSLRGAIGMLVAIMVVLVLIWIAYVWAIQDPRFSQVVAAGFGQPAGNAPPPQRSPSSATSQTAQPVLARRSIPCGHLGWASQKVPLAVVDVERQERRPLGPRFHTLGDDRVTDRAREVTEANDQGLPGQVGVDAADQADVELDERWPHLDQVVEVGDAAARAQRRPAKQVGTRR